MPINFTHDRWDKVKEKYRQYWAGELERPIFHVHLWGRDPGRPQPDAPLLSQETCAELNVPAADIIDRIDYEMSRIVYAGDAYPYFNMDCFGPGVIAAMLGGRLDNSSGRVWFFPGEERPIEEIHFKFNPDNVWFRRICDLYAAGMERWQGQVLMSMTDLGGNLDILSTFRPSEKLLFDLYDHPDEVKRLTWEAHEAWHRYYDAFNEVLQPLNPGYSDWSGIYSDAPSYMLQSDFSYMIGPQMFAEFVQPELEATTKRLERSFYHLDGIGQLHHLNLVRQMEHLDGIQWVPGDGKPGCDQWPDVYRKIQEAGKLIQIVEGGLDVIDAIVEQLGTGQGIHHRPMDYNLEEETRIKQHLASYGVE